jgi:hypothetical protein
MEVRDNEAAFVSGYKQSMQVVTADLHSGVHDEAGDVDGAGLTHAVRPPHSLLQDGRVHAGLQQEHMIGCIQANNVPGGKPDWLYASKQGCSSSFCQVCLTLRDAVGRAL